MPQNVPVFQFSENALRLRQYAYEHWCEHGVGPTLLDVHQELGLTRRQIQSAYKELQLGTICVVDQDSLNCNLLKLQPFSAFPSQVKTFIDGEFHSFAGCAMESIAFSKMPPFTGKDVRVESFCACCFEPVSFLSREMEMRDLSHPDLRIHVSLSPYDWNNNDILRMCDSMNFAIDEEHAERFEQQMGRRGVLYTIPQAEQFVKTTADSRMHDYHWGVVPVIPSIIVDFAKALGVDTAAWEA